MKKSLIGQSYVPHDNSYAVCINDDKKNYLLAGTMGQEAEETEIVTRPFTMYVKSEATGKIYLEKFIQVKCRRGLIHRVLFRAESIKKIQ